MKPHRNRFAVWLIVSLSSNAALAALLASLSGVGSGSHTLSARSRDLTNRLVRSSKLSVRPLPVPAPATNEVTEPFHWSQLESQDYRVYVANLRGVGCPEATIRDIITADVSELFRRRVKELVDPILSQFWELLADKEKFKNLVDEKETQLRNLKDEREAVLDELLGGDARRLAAEEEARQQQREARSQTLEFLSADKREACLATEEKFNQLRRQLGSAQPPLTRAEAVAAFERLQRKQDLEIQQTLSAEDWAEYKLRQSGFAQVRQRLAGFDATEDELRAVVRIREEVGSAPGSGPPAGRPGDSATQQAQQEALEELLGKDRLAEFERAQDTRFQEVYQVTDRLDLALDVAADAFAMRKAAEDQAREIQTNQALSPADREDLLKSIRAETERSLTQTLGEDAYKLYRKRFGYWLDQMTANAGR
jgi:hypothetical protein